MKQNLKMIGSVLLGNTLLALDNKAVYHSSDLQVYGKYGEIYKKYADSIADSAIFEGTLPNRTSVSEFADDYGNTYVFVLNREFEKELNAEIPLKGAYNLYEVSREDGKQYLKDENVSSIQVSLAPGDAVLLRLQNPGEELYTVDYQLEE